MTFCCFLVLGKLSKTIESTKEFLFKFNLYDYRQYQTHIIYIMKSKFYIMIRIICSLIYGQNILSVSNGKSCTFNIQCIDKLNNKHVSCYVCISTHDLFIFANKIIFLYFDDVLHKTFNTLNPLKTT